MQNKMQVFQNEVFGEIRTIEKCGEPWFVGKDVAKALGYSNASKAIISHVDSEDKAMEMIAHSQNGNVVTKTAIINESGLYSLILSSKLPSAKVFKRWVTSEVLPSIRKHGGYIKEELLDELLKSRETANLYLEMLKTQKELGKANEEFIVKLKDCVEVLTPQAHYCNVILRGHNSIPVSVIAKDYGMSAVKFNRILHACKIQYKTGGTWLLYSKYDNHGYTETVTYKENDVIVRIATYWTQKGRKFIYETLKKHGILPEIERIYVQLELSVI